MIDRKLQKLLKRVIRYLQRRESKLDVKINGKPITKKKKQEVCEHRWNYKLSDHFLTRLHERFNEYERDSVKNDFLKNHKYIRSRGNKGDRAIIGKVAVFYLAPYHDVIKTVVRKDEYSKMQAKRF